MSSAASVAAAASAAGGGSADMRSRASWRRRSVRRLVREEAEKARRLKLRRLERFGGLSRDEWTDMSDSIGTARPARRRLRVPSPPSPPSAESSTSASSSSSLFTGSIASFPADRPSASSTASLEPKPPASSSSARSCWRALKRRGGRGSAAPPFESSWSGAPGACATSPFVSASRGEAREDRRVVGITGAWRGPAAAAAAGGRSRRTREKGARRERGGAGVCAERRR